MNNRGYNRFLSMSGDATIKIDYDKVSKDERWMVIKVTRPTVHCRMTGS